MHLYFFFLCALCPLRRAQPISLGAERKEFLGPAFFQKGWWGSGQGPGKGGPGGFAPRSVRLLRVGEQDHANLHHPHPMNFSDSDL